MKNYIVELFYDGERYITVIQTNSKDARNNAIKRAKKELRARGVTSKINRVRAKLYCLVIK